MPLAFILPSLSYIRVEDGPLFSGTKKWAWAVAVFGIVCFIAGTVSLIMNFDKLSQCSHGEEMSYCYPALNATQ